MKYIVPEYYKDFQCKCGQCRHSCCDGWPIRISMKEYFQLIGIQCSDQLRVKLDCALKVCLEPSIDCYAQISYDWHGICMLHREDGLCALQLELGEDNLPEVCRLYPRNVKRLTELCECSCSNSCEEVVDLLLTMKQPMSFEENFLSVKPEFSIKLSSEEYGRCKKLIVIMQTRFLSLADRFLVLRNYLLGNVASSDINSAAFEILPLTDSDIISKRPENLSLAYVFLHILTKSFENSNSISDYCIVSQGYYCMEGKDKLSEEDLITVSKKYLSASDHLEEFLSDWQILFEQLIVNHMFFNTFPYVENFETMDDVFLSLAIMYSFLRFHTLGFMSDKVDSERLVDFLAAMFRLIDHSDFKHTIVKLFKKGKYPYQEIMTQLLYI